MLRGIDRNAFLRDDWQQRPRVFRQALPGFSPPLGGEELAALAMESDVESRLVEGAAESGWRLRHGPFVEQDFLDTPETDWTLLVQDVEKHLPDLVWIVDAFDMLPSWRLDDLMVSYAAPGGSVGPHVDAYDVFLLQGMGRRHWWIDDRPECARQETQTGGLRLLARFTPNRDWILEPGDVLYLPPGIPHHGVALDACTTWSVGLRAPSLGDTLAELAEVLESENRAQTPFADPRRAHADHPLLVDVRTRRSVRQQLRRLLQDDQLLDHALAQCLSRSKPGFMDMGAGSSLTDMLDGAPASAVLRRNPAVSFALLPGDGDRAASLYINGERFDLPGASEALVEQMTVARDISVKALDPMLEDPIGRQLLEQWVHRGYWIAR